MLQLRNETAMAAEVLVLPDADGVETVAALVKGTFDLRRLDLSGTPALADGQRPVALADEHHGDPERTSIRIASDLTLGKPGTDVLLTGTARAPGGRPVAWMDVSLVLGPVRKIVRVIGERAWDRGAATPPRPFERMPLTWERAFGGGDGGETDERNPVGRGFASADRPDDGAPLPNLEDPFHPLRAWGDAPPPAAFAPVAPHWLPRRAFAGTYDDAWRRTRAPYLPADFDPRFFRAAPDGLTAPGGLTGGEAVTVEGVAEDAPLRFVLPRACPAVDFRVDAGCESPVPRLETVLVEPDEARVVLVWRAALPCGRRLPRVREITVRSA